MSVWFINVPDSSLRHPLEACSAVCAPCCSLRGQGWSCAVPGLQQGWGCLLPGTGEPGSAPCPPVEPLRMDFIAALLPSSIHAAPTADVAQALPFTAMWQLLVTNRSKGRTCWCSSAFLRLLFLSEIILVLSLHWHLSTSLPSIPQQFQGQERGWWPVLCQLHTCPSYFSVSFFFGH